MKKRHEVAFVVDRGILLTDFIETTLDSFNDCIKSLAQKAVQEDIETNITLVMFDNSVEVKYVSVPVQDCKPLDKSMFTDVTSTAWRYAFKIVSDVLDSATNSTSMEPEEVTSALEIYIQ